MQELSRHTLAAVFGGKKQGSPPIPRPRPPEAPRDDRTWGERVEQNLRQRGLDEKVDPQMVLTPPSIDSGMEFNRLPGAGDKLGI